MHLPTAQQLMLVYERIGKDINEADAIIRTLPETERTQHLHALAGMVNYIWFNLQAPIVREHGELDPDKDYFQKK